MNLKRSWILLPLLAIWGCGGSGGPGNLNAGNSPTNVTREHVSQTRNFGAGAMLHSGVQNPGFASAMNGAPAPGGMGSGSPAPMLGGFIRHLPPQGLLHPTEGGGGGTMPPDPWPMPTFYYDDWLGLWVQVTITLTSNTMDFYEDQGKTKPAGHMLSTWPLNWGTYPVSWHSDYAFTAGSMSGSHGSSDATMTSESSGSFVYDDTWTGSRYQGSSSWSLTGSTWSNRTDNSDGTWSNDTGNYGADGSGTTTCENSLGYRSTFNWHADGSGDGKLEGPDPGLPATIVWNEVGVGTITYADGTVEEFRWWSWLTPAGGGTGSGGSTGPGEGSGGAPPPGGMGL